jgi:hypothetical protein
MYVLLGSMVIFGALLYSPLNFATVAAVLGAVAPHATPPGSTVGDDPLGDTGVVGVAAGLESPPLRSATAAKLPPPMATTAARPPASQR